MAEMLNLEQLKAKAESLIKSISGDKDLLASFSKNWGSYALPQPDPRRQIYTFLEGTYRPRWAQGWEGALGLGFDHGSLIGNSFGGQLTIRKRLALGK
jgi:hypothetical protein